MGNRDTAEQLEVAIEECGRLERQAVELRAEAYVMEHRANRFIAEVVAERDAAQAETLTLRAEIDRMEADCTDHQGRMSTERDASLAVVEEVRAVMDKPSEPNSFYLTGFPNQYEALADGYGDDLPNALRAALTKSPQRTATSPRIATQATGAELHADAHKQPEQGTEGES